MASAVTHTDKTFSHFLTQKPYHTYSYYGELVPFLFPFSHFTPYKSGLINLITINHIFI